MVSGTRELAMIIGKHCNKNKLKHAVQMIVCSAWAITLAVGGSILPSFGETFTSEAAAAKLVAQQIAEDSYSQICDLDAPDHLTVTTDGDYVKAQWDAVTDADQYRVALVSGAEESLETEDLTSERNDWLVVNDTSYKFEKLERGSYRIAVMAVQREVDDWDYGILHYSLISYSDVITVSGYDFYLSSVKQTALDQVTVKWQACPEGDSLQILRSTSKNGTYTVVKTLSDASKTSVKTSIPEIGTKYYYKVEALDAEGNVVGYSDIRSITPKVYKPVVTAATDSATAIRISWDSFMPGVYGYEIKSSDAEDGNYKLVKRVTDTEKSAYVHSGLSVNETRYYKVRVYTLNSDGTRKYSGYSDVVSAKAKLKKAKLTRVEIVDENTVSLAWNKVAGASGYKVAYKTSAQDSYKTKSVSNNTDMALTIKGLKDGTTYNFKVRAYKKTDEKTYYGSYSAVKTITLPESSDTDYGTENYIPAGPNDTQQEKCLRIFGQTEMRRYDSRSEAEADMVTISVKCWDFADSSQTTKKTVTYKFEVHKNIASDVKAVFEDIYNGAEKFPIHSVIGYGWRGDGSKSEHNLGVAIDINPDENYFVTKDGEILSGKYWKPGVDPYSIPEYGDVENAFIAHGFTRGRWSTKTDYMHFSFFGT